MSNIFGISPVSLYDILGQPKMDGDWENKEQTLEIYRQIYSEYADLIDKYQENTLSDDERIELKAGLKQNAGRYFEQITEEQILEAIFVNKNVMLEEVLQGMQQFLSEEIKALCEKAFLKASDPVTVSLVQSYE